LPLPSNEKASTCPSPSKVCRPAVCNAHIAAGNKAVAGLSQKDDRPQCAGAWHELLGCAAFRARQGVPWCRPQHSQHAQLCSEHVLEPTG
jgi:hypothetical protein